MIAYSQINKASITRAVKKCQAVKPLVKVTGYGVFTVNGSKGDVYTVKFSKVEGELNADCTCYAQTNGKRVSLCYHVVACSSLFKQQATERAATALALCTDCRLDTATSKEGRCRDCQLVKDANDIF